MHKISDQARENLSQNLLGRLKLKLFEKMTGKKYYSPDKRQCESFILKQAQSDTYFTECLINILNIKSSYNIKYPDFNQLYDLKDLLQNLEAFPLDNALFLEIIEYPEYLTENLGVVVDCKAINDTADSGYLYTARIINEVLFPNELIGTFVIRASTSYPNPTFSTLLPHGWEIFDINNCHNIAFSSLIIPILAFISEKTKPHLSDTKKLLDSQVGSFLKPPIDPKLQKLIQSAYLNITKCSIVEIPLSLICPYDFNFCFSYPLEVVETFKRMHGTKKLVQPTLKNCLLVYWDKDHFVMNDDYAHYLAYRVLKIQIVPCTVIGKYPHNIGKAICVGGSELIPPPSVAEIPNLNISELEMKRKNEKFLDKRLDSMTKKDPKSNLYALFWELSKLIQNPSTKERELHEFILKHPISLDTYNFNILSEFRFGNDYRADLVLEYKFNDKRIIFVELEKASLPIFTKAKRETYHVNHAIQQVGDWLRWCRENPNQIPQPLDSSLPMEGLVVIGRSLNMSENDKKILLHNNQNRLVKVITYDDLLSRIEALIYNLEDNS
ncbi:MAG: DUF4263 domain-containing protein [Pseudanabaenaceae cyanobacterium bins.39]|nr:DUF4263 domain-containing protein [Pseudanabaenaceae cyanobacterium bins.39]